MAINKRKILQSAQKHLQKGALDKALKDYQTVLEADRGDVNVRLKVGDIHLKQGNEAEAVQHYLKVASRFMKDGFDAKAVALYKQILRLDDKRLDVFLPLAELYQRLGLNSDAMVTMQSAADTYYRDGNRDQALELLRKMAALDPSNTTNRLKVADLLRQEGYENDAVAELLAAAEELARQNDREGRVSTLARVVEMRPEDPEHLVSLGHAQLVCAHHAQAEETARKLVELQPDEPDGHEVLAAALEGLGRGTEAHDVYRKLAEVYRDRGDDARARDLMQRFGALDPLSADTAEPVLPEAPGETNEPVFDDGADLAFGDVPAEDLGLETDEFADPGFLPDDSMSLANSLSGAAPLVAEPSAPNPEDSATGLPPLAPAQGLAAHEDPNQVVAEAGVYLRYGKQDRARVALEALIVSHPHHLAGLEKLGEARLACDDAAGAAQAFVHAASLAADQGDLESFGNLRVKLAEIDPAAADALRAPAGPTAPTALAPEPAVDDEGEIDIDLDLDHDGSIDMSTAAEDGVEPAPGPDEAGSEDDAGGEVDLTDMVDLGDEAFDLSATEESVVERDAEPMFAPDDGAAIEHEDEPAIRLDSAEPERALDEVDPSADLGGALDAEIDLGDAAADAIASATESSAEPEPSAAAEDDAPENGSSTTPQQIVEELEEADFYFQQNMFDEAREIYARIVEIAPNHPQAQLRLGEIEAQTADGPTASASDDEDALFATDDGDAGLDLGTDQDVFADESETGFALSDDLSHDSELDLSETEGFDLSGAEGEPLDLSDEAAGVAEADPGEGSSSLIPELPDLSELDSDESLGLSDQESDPGLEAQAESHVAASTESGFDEIAGADDAEEMTRQSAADELSDEVDPAGIAATDESLGTDDEDDPNGKSFDLAAELSGAFDANEEHAESTAGSTEGEGFEEVFAAFKAGVQKELDAGDYDAHFDLGIAYKEMGLLDDAIGEFAKAMKAEGRAQACLHMMGVCALDLGRSADAVAHLQQALSLPDLPDDQSIGLNYDLGRALQSSGDLEAARSAYERVLAHDEGFADVLVRLEALEAGEVLDEPAPDDLSDDAEAFESFDDLIGTGDAEAREEPAPPAFENFEDLIGGEDDDEDDDDARRSDGETDEDDSLVRDSGFSSDAGSGMSPPGAAHVTQPVLDALESELDPFEPTPPDEDESPPDAASEVEPEPADEPREPVSVADDTAPLRERRKRRKRISFF